MSSRTELYALGHGQAIATAARSSSGQASSFRVEHLADQVLQVRVKFAARTTGPAPLCSPTGTSFGTITTSGSRRRDLFSTKLVELPRVGRLPVGGRRSSAPAFASRRDVITLLYGDFQDAASEVVLAGPLLQLDDSAGDRASRIRPEYDI